MASKSFFKRLLDENPDELIKTPKESPEKNPAENAEKLRKKNKDLVLAICGCMVEQPEILQKVLDTYKEVNLLLCTKY